MTIDDPTLPYDLEAEIRRALRLRADAYVVRSVPVGTLVALPIPSERRSPRTLIAAAVAVALIIVGAVLVARVLVSGDSGSDQRPAGPPTSTPIPTTEPSPVPEATQVPLTAVDTPASAKGETGADPLAKVDRVQTFSTGAGPPVTFTDVTDSEGERSRVFSVETIYDRNYVPGEDDSKTVWQRTGTSGSTAGGVMQIVHYPHLTTPDDPIIFYAWTGLPDGTDYVLFETTGQLLWQRPIDGFAVFPIHDEPVDATLRAIGGDGSVLTEEPITKSYNGAAYIPGQPQPRVVVDPRYPSCRVSVLEDGLITVFDEGTRSAVKITPEEYCAGMDGVVSGQLPYTPPELRAAGIRLVKKFENGAFVPTYVEAKSDAAVNPEPISAEEVRRRVAEAKDKR